MKYLYHNTNRRKRANISRSFFEKMARIEAIYKEEGYPADIRIDNEIIKLYDKYTKKYGTDWF